MMVVRVRQRRRAGVMLAAALLLGACSGDDDDESAGGGDGGGAQTLPTLPSTSEDAVSTVTTVDEREAAAEALEAELRAAYERYWETTDELFQSPNPDDPRLADVTTGLSLTVIRDALATRQVEGVTEGSGPLDAREVLSVDWEGRGDPEHDPSTVTEAQVESCIVEDAVLVDASGTVLDENLGTARWEQTMVLEAGVWKVSETGFFDVVEGVSSCDSEP